MSTFQDIQAEIITGYEAITLPNGIGAPTGYKHEPKGGFGASDLPAVVVTRSVMLGREPLSTNRNIVRREYIVDLYCYTTDETDRVKTSDRNNTADCIDTIQDYFTPGGLTTTGVIYHNISADTGDVELFARDNTQHYVGVRFRHEVTYIQTY